MLGNSGDKPDYSGAPGQEQRFMTDVSLQPSAVICGWIKTMLVTGALRSVIYTQG